ncbi:hypothetical protein PINS_up020025 [Pythium insidiosum]|nr:hypothetical protein PINS_up020025 [Pythium insidiosum]
MRRLLDLSRYTIAAVTHDAPSTPSPSPSSSPSPSPSPSQAQTQVSSHEPGTARRVMLDGITIPRREQARVLEQTLQLLFVIEALAVSTFLQALVPGVLGTSAIVLGTEG